MILYKAVSLLMKLKTAFIQLQVWHCKQTILRTVKNCGDGLKVNGVTTLSENTTLGNNVNFNGMKISGKGNVTIGDNFHSGTDCLMITQTHNFDNGTAIPYDTTYIYEDITIEDNVWLGSRVVLLSGVTIGEGAIIQAGSVVVNDIPAYSVAGGHPAKVFKTRDIEHYKKLKSEGKFI